MQGAFTMMLLAKIPDNGNFNTVKSQLATLGDQISVEIKVARQEIFLMPCIGFNMRWIGNRTYQS